MLPLRVSINQGGKNWVVSNQFSSSHLRAVSNERELE